MTKDQKEIDFEIIWKKINHTLSKEEKIELLQWLEDDPSHQEYLEHATDYYQHGSGFRNVEEEKAVIWNTIKNNQLKKDHRKYRRIISFAAAVAILAMIFTYFEYSATSTQTAELAEKKELISPGTNQATLILDDGSVYNLSTSKNLVLNEGGSLIHSEGTSLQYTEEAAAPKETKYNTLTVPRGGEFFLQLADGTKVWLNSETTLRYPVQFNGTERRVELTGEAYFEVVRDEKVPFLVESGDQVTRVLGTEFNISSYRENPEITTTLVKGRVETYTKNAPATRLQLAPNEQSIFLKKEDSLTKHTVDTYKYIAWKSGRFVFEDQDLGEIMGTLSRWYNIEVLFEKEDLRIIRFTGNLQRYSDFGAILSKIALTEEVDFEIENRKVTIK